MLKRENNVGAHDFFGSVNLSFRLGFLVAGAGAEPGSGFRAGAGVAEVGDAFGTGDGVTEGGRLAGGGG